MLLTMIDDSGTRRPYFFTESDGFTRAFEFITEVGNINVAANANLLAYTDAKGTHLTDLTGASIAEFPDAKRAVPHPDGKYVAIETDGAPSSTD